jgi:hypothetical protein
MISFYGEELLAPRPTPKLENHPLSAVRDCLFNIFAATRHIGGRSSIRKPRTRHAVVTGIHLSRLKQTTWRLCTVWRFFPLKYPLWVRLRKDNSNLYFYPAMYIVRWLELFVMQFPVDQCLNSHTTSWDLGGDSIWLNKLPNFHVKLWIHFTRYIKMVYRPTHNLLSTSGAR